MPLSSRFIHFCAHDSGSLLKVTRFVMPTVTRRSMFALDCFRCVGFGNSANRKAAARKCPPCEPEYGNGSNCGG